MPYIRKVLVLVIILLVLAVGLNYLNRVRQAISLSQNKRTQESIEINSKDWETYKNQEAGFSVKHPPFFYAATKELKTFNVTFLHASLKNSEIPIDIQPRVAIYQSNLNLSETLKTSNENRNKDQFPEFTEISIDDKKAYQTKAIDPEVVFIHTIVGDDKNAFITELFTTLTTSEDNKIMLKVYAEMLESFEMLE